MNARRAMALAANTAWQWSCRPARRRFEAALGDAAAAQALRLRTVLEANAASLAGRRHDFAALRSPRDFRRRVPVTDYEGCRADIEAVAGGRPNVLTTAPVRALQPTGGSTGGTKLIPYTAPLGAEFRAALDPWIGALFAQFPGARRGRAYWSASPPVPARPDTRPDGVGPRVGFADDADYLPPLARRLHRAAIVPPAPGLGTCGDEREFRLATAARLAAADDLALVSVWSPTFLSVLVNTLFDEGGEVAARMAAAPDGGTQRRADALREALRAGSRAAALRRLWPRLALISCWTHGPSAPFVAALKADFPHADIQGKGLLATEAFVSIPYARYADPVLAVASHFFEFQDTGTRAEHALAHELQVGRTYSVTVTTAGGLYRYRLGDVVEVTGRLRQAPCLRFVGREGGVSDRRGEKLHPVHVQRGINAALDACGVRSIFSMLAPVEPPDAPPAYTLFVAAPAATDAALAALAGPLERSLCDNFHYAHARRIGQLATARVFAIDTRRADPAAIYLRTLAERGRRLGDIKPTPLDPTPGWETRFPGQGVSP